MPKFTCSLQLYPIIGSKNPGFIYPPAALAFHERTSKLVFTIQTMGEKSSVTLMVYDIKNKGFRFISTINSLNQMKDVVVHKLIVDSKGEYAALSFLSEEDKLFQNYVYVYNLKTGEKVNLNKLFSKTIPCTNFWEEDHLIFPSWDNGNPLTYAYNPKKNLFKKYP